MVRNPGLPPQVGVASGVTPPPGAAGPAGASFVAASEGDLVSGATVVTVARPAGTSDGDVMLAHIAGRGTGTMTCTPPAGWTQEVSQARGSGGRMFVYSKVASSEPASYDFTLSTSSSHVGAIETWRGVDTVDPVLAAAASDNGGSTAQVCPSVDTTGTDGAPIIHSAMGASLTGGGSYSWPAGTTERTDDEELTGGSGYLTTATRVQATGGPTGTTTATCSLSMTNVTTTVALRPAA